MTRLDVGRLRAPWFSPTSRCGLDSLHMNDKIEGSSVGEEENVTAGFGNAQPSPAQSVTISDVAEAAGVSRQTVSNVLNAPSRVRAETRERVSRAIADLGYHPNHMARSLRASSPRMIGCRIVPMHAETVAAIQDRFLHALAEAGQECGHHLLLFAATDVAAETEQCTALWRAGVVSGVVLYDITPDDPRPGRLTAAGVPFTAFGRTAVGTESYSWADVDNSAGTASAVDHLVAAGHRRIGFLGWPEGSSAGDARAHGWLTAVDRHGLLAASHRLDVRGDDTTTTGSRLMRELLDRPSPPTAVVAATDTFAVGALHAVRDQGLRPGRDVAVVGFDDSPAAAAMGLSSVRQPIKEVGRLVMAEVLRLTGRPVGADGEPPPEPLRRLLAPELVVRASSAPSQGSRPPAGPDASPLCL
ncbi:LacI family DNA-binding transcriptional regulator [Streptomyces bluensis]|uniref:LacI family DNA-binding transcriptional regulator n=1 Tax=Streptomyces bluensis TaxID=33897 RepID=UPI0019B0EB24|nr:LacI family DNA-binding transcriptional regulator [Streptomyces bluensis]GGZ65579.1 alanine racemase [Streptomyces bluensis]